MTRINPLPIGRTVFGLASASLVVGLCAVHAALAAQEWPPAPVLAAVTDDTPGPLPPSVQAEAVAQRRWRCTFSYLPEGAAQTVTLAGTFNGWSRDAAPLTGPNPEGAWSGTVELPGGVHLYKFVVDGDQWHRDSRNPDGVPDGHSGQNSVLRLGRIARLTESDAEIGDGRIEGLALEHDPSRPLYFQPLTSERALVRYRTLARDVERVTLVTRTGLATELQVADQDSVFALWEAEAPLFPADPEAPDDTPVLDERAAVEYTFVLTDGATRVSDPTTYRAANLGDQIFRTPEWAKHAIWYQVFPDRFRNGDPSNDPQPVRPWTSEWFTPSPWEGKDGQTFYNHYVFDRFYGGDIAGLEEKLPYLRELGVNALYLNPIFKATSNHKYNATNYLHVDDHFGTKGDYDAVAATEDITDPTTWKWTESDRRFLRFLKAAHAQGFRVIIDGVFNHVGTAHPAFQDVKKHGQESPYADWFHVTSWKPFKYEGWFGVKSLPVFKKSPDGLASAAAKKHIFDVTRRWMDPDGNGDPSDGIDGWRLDVPNEIPAPFWVEWRALVKSINPDAYISGEIWERADPWLDGRHFDAVMNYEFSRAACAWVFDRKQKITVSEIDRRLRELRVAYPLAATLVLQNLMNSHDTDRVASMAHNPDRAYNHGNRVQDNGPDYDNSKPPPAAYARARLTALLQMTYVGAPMIYYGDEAGMWGADDPTCRKPMLWEDLEPYDKPEENFVMKDHLAYYRQIIALRNAHPALRTGSYQTLLTDDEADVWAFLRRNNDEQLVVVLNAADQDREVAVPLPRSAANHWTVVFGADGRFTATDHKVSVRVPAVGGLVLRAATPK